VSRQASGAKKREGAGGLKGEYQLLVDYPNPTNIVNAFEVFLNAEGLALAQKKEKKSIFQPAQAR